MFFALNFAMALVNYDAALPRRYEASLDIPFATFRYGEWRVCRGEGWRGQLANQIFRHDGDILSSLSHFASAFFPCLENWNSWLATDSSLSWGTPPPPTPLTCRIVARGLEGVLLSQHFIVIIYILHLFCFFAALALKLQLKKMKAHFAACFSRLSSNFN